jgi:hypothetical protein
MTWPTQSHYEITFDGFPRLEDWYSSIDKVFTTNSKTYPVLIILQQDHDQIQGLHIVFPLKMFP